MSFVEQLLRDPDIEPTSAALTKALREAYDAYVKFINELAKLYIDLEWHYYTDGKAWLEKGVYKWTGTRGGHISGESANGYIKPAA